jgi:hypothetical protein
MMRALVIVVVVASCVHPAAQVAAVAGTAWRMTSGDDSRVAPGPGVALDIISEREGVSVGTHVGWISGWNRTLWREGTPTDERSFDSLLQLHVLIQDRVGALAIGGGIGLDNHAASGHYADAPDSPSFSSSDAALGAHASASYDVAHTDAGTFAIYVGAAVFHVLAGADLCPGDCTAPAQTVAAWAGAAFRLR